MNSVFRNPLRNEGVSQAERTQEALKEGYVKIDERNTEDFLTFANDMSGLINFYNSDNVLDGTWKEFFESDVSVLLAQVAKTDLSNL